MTDDLRLVLDPFAGAPPRRVRTRAMLEAIDGARSRVWLESYIFEPDGLGRRVLDALVAAARRGADVVLLYDVFGSPNLTEDVLRPLCAAGGRAVGFNPMWKLVRRSPFASTSSMREP